MPTGVEKATQFAVLITNQEHGYPADDASRPTPADREFIDDTGANPPVAEYPLSFEFEECLICVPRGGERSRLSDTWRVWDLA